MAKIYSQCSLADKNSSIKTSSETSWCTFISFPLQLTVWESSLYIFSLAKIKGQLRTLKSGIWRIKHVTCSVGYLKTTLDLTVHSKNIFCERIDGFLLEITFIMDYNLNIFHIYLLSVCVFVYYLNRRIIL